MKKTTTCIYIILGLLLIVQCGADKQTEQMQKTKEAQEDLFSKISLAENEYKKNGASDKIITLYQTFIDSFPKHDSTPVYCMQLGNIYLNKNPKYAVQYFTKIVKNYTTFKNHSDCLYLLADLMDAQYNEREQAKKYYIEYSQKYKTGKFIQDVENRLITIDSIPYNTLVNKYIITGKLPALLEKAKSASN